MNLGVTENEQEKAVELATMPLSIVHRHWKWVYRGKPSKEMIQRVPVAQHKGGTCTGRGYVR